MLALAYPIELETLRHPSFIAIKQLRMLLSLHTIQLTLLYNLNQERIACQLQIVVSTIASISLIIQYCLGILYSVLTV